MEHHTFIILVFSFIKYGASDNFYDSLFSFLIYIIIVHLNCLYFDLELKFLSFKIIISNENFNVTIIHFI